MAGIWSSDCKSHSKVEWKTELACWSSSPEFTRNLFYPLFAEAELLNEGDLVSYLASQRLIFWNTSLTSPWRKKKEANQQYLLAYLCWSASVVLLKQNWDETQCTCSGCLPANTEEWLLLKLPFKTEVHGVIVLILPHCLITANAQTLIVWPVFNHST